MMRRKPKERPSVSMKIGKETRKADPTRKPRPESLIEIQAHAIFEKCGTPKTFAANQAAGIVVEGFNRETSR